MRAVVLVGGEGTRLRPLTSVDPKQMLPVAGVPMLERVLDQLSVHGIDDIVLSLGYRPEVFIEAYPAGRHGARTIFHAVEPEPRDTAGAIRFAADAAGLDETFLVVNGDVLTDLDIGELVEFHLRRAAQATISLTPVEDPSAFGVVPTDADGRVEAFIEKPPRDQALTNLVNAGTYVMEPAVLGLIASVGRVSVEKETFPILVKEGSLFALPSKEYWLDTGTPALFLQAVLDILDGRRQFRAPMPGVTEVREGLWSGPGVSLEGEVSGPALIEEGAEVKAGAMVSNSHLGAGAVVETGARVTGSVVLAGAKVGEGAVVEHSIVGPGARIGEGAKVLAVSVVGHCATLEAGATLRDARHPRPEG
jgi:mannose-1-phosphate guanylyltransferase